MWNVRYIKFIDSLRNANRINKEGQKFSRMDVRNFECICRRETLMLPMEQFRNLTLLHQILLVALKSPSIVVTKFCTLLQKSQNKLWNWNDSEKIDDGQHLLFVRQTLADFSSRWSFDGGLWEKRHNLFCIHLIGNVSQGCNIEH